MKTHTDVLICGAGATGLVLALDLARRGIPFLLVDKLAQPFHGSRGKGLQPRSLEIFEALGVLDRLAASGGPYPPLRRHLPDGGHIDLPIGGVFQDSPSTPAEPYRMPLMVAQATTEAILRARLLELGHSPRYGHAVVGFDQDGDGVDVRVEAPDGVRTVRARYLVGADGGGSFVRRTLDIGFRGRTLGQRALVADLAVTGLGRDAWHQFNEASDRLTMLCPLMGTDDLFQVQAALPPTGDIDLSPAGLEALLRERCNGLDLRVIRAPWASVYEMNARLAERYRLGRVLLAGDAAHVHPPTGGQGLNTSVQDAWNLGWKLAAVLQGAPEALLDTYEAERRAVASDILEMSSRLLDNARRGDHGRGRETLQLELGYREGPLAPASTCPAAVCPGDRAPDARLQGAAGQARRLFDLLGGPHWTLLAAGDPRPLPATAGIRTHVIGPAGELRDVHGDFAAAYGLPPGGWALVRPDGYLGPIGTGEQLPGLQDWLAQVLPPPAS